MQQSLINKMGVEINIIGAISIIIPSISSIKFNNKANRIGLPVRLRMAFAANSGTCKRVNK